MKNCIISYMITASNHNGPIMWYNQTVTKYIFRNGKTQFHA